jgi:hypothetical protein
MELGWQDAAVAMLAGVAVAWLVARRMRARHRPGCEDCPGCAPRRHDGAASGASEAPPAGGATIIPLSELTRRE